MARRKEVAVGRLVPGGGADVGGGGDFGMRLGVCILVFVSIVGGGMGRLVKFIWCGPFDVKVFPGRFGVKKKAVVF